MIHLALRARQVQPSATLALSARAAELKKQGLPVIALVAGEPDFDTPQEIKDAAAAAMAAGFTKYTDSSGIPELRAGIADRINRACGSAYDPSQVVVSNGAKHSVQNLLLALVEDGDEVILPSPYWVSYPDMVRLCGGVPQAVPCREDNFHLEADVLRASVGPRSKVVVLNNPNNPTGAVYTPEELKAILDVCREKGLFVISDEIYEPLVFPRLDGKGERTFASVASFGPEVRELSAIVNGCSKAYAMTGWRIGWAAGPKPLMKAVADIQSQMTSNPCSISQKAAVRALALPADWGRKMAQEFDRRRRLVMERLNALPGVRCPEPEGAYYVFPRVESWYGKTVAGTEIRNSLDFARVCLEKAHVAFVPGAPFGDDRCIRLSYTLSMDTLGEAIDRLAKLLR